jgi:hypothetical protein
MHRRGFAVPLLKKRKRDLIQDICATVWEQLRQDRRLATGRLGADEFQVGSARDDDLKFADDARMHCAIRAASALVE